MKRIGLTLLAILLVASTTFSQIINIPSEFTSIQAGIDAATDGDTVLVAENTYFENINFLGKAITVASRFILDGDTSHISKTIIDGSQFVDWRKGSTVLMESGEDTTSVLMGFTITGGEGTQVKRGTQIIYCGAGINIMNSGGKILHNIIKANHMTSKFGQLNLLGSGVNAIVNRNHTAIIRNNMIIENSVIGGYIYGAGISMYGGRCIVESNTIKNNKLLGEMIFGVAIFWENYGDSGTIEEVIIRNNLISENEGNASGDWLYGGAIGTGYRFQEGIIEIYNNIVSDNTIEGKGGGFYSLENPTLVYNNTFYNNAAEGGGNQIGLDNGIIYMFNNVFWSDLDNGNEDFYLGSSLQAYNNLLKKPLGLVASIISKGNLYLEPIFKSDLFELAENSPGIGRGIDSILVGSTWVKPPKFDFRGNSRPADVDQFVDIGAIESEYEQPVYSNADLALVGMTGHSLDPPFQKDTLKYLLVKNPGNKVIGNLEIFTDDNLATVELDTAVDLFSEDVLDRTSTILVTAMDGTAQKEYAVVYKYLSSEANLTTLEVSLGKLIPPFDPSVTAYYDTIPYGMKISVPEVVCIATDTSSTLAVESAQDIYNQFEVLRTTTIYVTSPSDLVTKEYTILFTVDMTRPELTVIHDSVELGEEIGVVVYEPGQVYLVPENTAGIYDSIITAALIELETGITDTVFLSTEELDSTTYWLYACGRYQSLSEYQAITLYISTEVTKFRNEGFRMYPNPTTDLLNIEIDMFDLCRIEISSLNGQLLKAFKLEGTTHQLDLSSFQKGVYFITIRSKGFVATRKIVKL